MRVAIVHDWLSAYGGGERVLEQLLNCYPDADLYALVDFLPPEQRAFLGGREVRTSFIQHLPFARKHFRHYLPFMPFAVEQFNLRAYDLVISNSHAVAKGVITGPDQLHVSYCLSPMRYAWDLKFQYLSDTGLDRKRRGWPVRWTLHRLRQWDYCSSAGVDRFVGISRSIARRIRKVYRREAAVIHPPVDVEAFPLQEQKEDFYLTVSRRVPYKRMDLVVEAFSSMPDHRLIVIGPGTENSKLRAKGGPNIEFLGEQPFESVRDHMQRARAFVFAGEEDFGIVLVEAQACGTPVIAFNRGGALDTVLGLDQETPTGVFFAEQTPVALCGAVKEFEENGTVITPRNCRKNAERFGVRRFQSEFKAFVSDAYEAFQAEKA